MKAQILRHGRMKVTINFEILRCTVKEIRHSTGTQVNMQSVRAFS